MERRRNIFYRVFRFYIDGFRSMTWGRSLWVIIISKLFVIPKIFFFPNFLKTNFYTNEERSKHVIDALTNPNQ